MKRTPAPTTSQANVLFFLTAVVTLASSIVFAPRLGIGTNLWINEFVYILLPPLLLATVQGWSLEEVYRLKDTSTRNRLLSLLAGVSLWFTAFYLSTLTRHFLDAKLGVIVSEAPAAHSSLYQTLLLLLGMVVLAPICEEFYFRGFVQAAYERYSPKYGFVIAGVLFGSYHILNGLTEVVPASMLGVAMGYLVYKTNSLATSMLFHMAANASSILFGGVLGLSTASVMPSWMHFVALGGLVLTLVLLRSVDGQPQQHQPRAEEKMSPRGILFLVLTILFFLAAGAAEIAARLGVVG